MASFGSEPSIQALMDQPATLTFWQGEQVVRCVNGIITSFNQAESDSKVFSHWAINPVIFIKSEKSFDEVYHQLRKWTHLKNPETGEWYFFRFYDPLVLNRYIAQSQREYWFYLVGRLLAENNELDYFALLEQLWEQTHFSPINLLQALMNNLIEKEKNNGN